MDYSKFKENENKYVELKSKLDSGSINSEELKVTLKKMMIRDEEGNYWMIGSNTGKWYIYNGTEWKEKDPYSGVDLSKTQNFNNTPNKTVVIHHDDEKLNTELTIDKTADEDLSEKKEEEILFENENTEHKSFGTSDIQSEESHSVEVANDNTTQQDRLSAKDNLGTLCLICKSKIDEHSVYCGHCGANQKGLTSKKSRSEEELLIRSVKITSMIFFFGGLGLIVGVIFGATFGIFDIFKDLLSKFPEMLAETRGKIQGGLIFAALGGIGGFFGSAIIFGFTGLVYNVFSSIFGGIRIRTR